jgi:lysyl-tRNA synthetase, class II
MNELELIDMRISEDHFHAYENIIKNGGKPYASSVSRTISIKDLKVLRPKEFIISGRILNKNNEGFILYDGSDTVWVESSENLVQTGDIVEIFSEVFKEKILFPKIKIITKSLAKLPSTNEWESMSKESKAKYRDIGMIIVPEIKQVFINRSRINSSIREYFENDGFIEVETPILVSYPEIAPVRPFVIEEPRYIQSLDLRITNTEYIRRLMVAGFEKVYQLGKCFRDEPCSFKHHQEFTQLTFGIAYTDYFTLMKSIEELTYKLAIKIKGSPIITFGGTDIDLTPPWKRIRVRDALLEYTSIDIDKFNSHEDILKEMKDKGLKPPIKYDYGGFLKMANIVDNLIEEYVIDKLVQPTFFYEYPYYLGGPAKEIEDNKSYKKRCEVFIKGIELANVSTPQNDPLKIRAWYKDTLKLKQESGWKNQILDEPYLHAIDQGIPLCATGGLGVDRLMMFLLEKTDIEDVILFPWRKVQ